MFIEDWSQSHIALAKVLLGIWQMASGVCLLVTGGLILWIGRLGDGVGVPAGKMAISYFTVVPASIVGLYLWFFGMFGFGVLLLVMFGIGFFVSGGGLLLGRIWAGELAAALCLLNTLILLVSIRTGHGLVLHRFASGQSAFIVCAVLMVLVNTGCALYLFRH